MSWYRDWFDSEAYEVVYRERDLTDARRLIHLIERAARPEPGARILDVACGRGRHARLLATLGYRVTGIDLSPNAIRTARERAAREGLDVEFQVADMRDLPFEGAFDGIVNLFTSFGYFDDDAQHQAAIAQMARAVVPGGFLVQDFMNAERAAATLVPEDERTTAADGIGTVTIHQRRWLAEGPGGRRINKRIDLTCYEHPEGEPDTFTFTESVRLLERSDFERMYAAAGMEIEAAFGDYDGAPPSPDAPRLILLARRTA
jgi:SAM-dependent methyltransferase